MKKEALSSFFVKHKGSRMLGKYLITLLSGEVSQTFSFDSSAQAALWLGLEKRVGAENALARIESSDGALTLRAVSEGLTIGSSPSAPVPQGEEFVAVLRRPDSAPITVFVRPVIPGIGRYRKLAFNGDVEFLIGRDSVSGFLYESRFVSARHAKVRHKHGGFEVVDLESGNGTTVNGTKLIPLQPKKIVPGDVVQILDLVFGVGDGFLTINNPPRFHIRVPHSGIVTHETIVKSWPAVSLRDGEPDLFYPAPRLSKTIHPIKLQVDDPPAKKEPDEQPVLMQIGPSFLMGMSSVLMVSNSISQVANGGSIMQALPSISMAVAMVGGSVVWPIISRSYNRKKDERDEARRNRMYVSYLDSIETKLQNEASLQVEIHQENRRPVSELLERAHCLSPLLMSHTIVQNDFMDLRVGVGDVPISAEIRWPERHFSLQDDRMLDRVSDMAKHPPLLRDIPLAFDPASFPITGILGERSEAWDFLRGLLIQVCSLYSYQEVKIMVIGSPDERAEWSFLDSLGHLYDDSRQHRYVALSYSGMVEESLLIERELAIRSEEKAEVLGDYGTYYIIVCADHALAARSEAIKRLSKLRSNKGFSLIYLAEALRDLPRECSYIIDLARDGGSRLGITLAQESNADRRPRSARMFERSDVSGTIIHFDPDIMVSKERADAFALALARVRLDIPEQRQTMPDSVGFLEMFEVGNVAHLNIGQRWSENDASQSLQTCIGIDEHGEPAYLNLHESIHGPHGLIAGTTGSGKSEFIITFILSLCVNYAPDEVAFVLIDYKGGGLAGAFENDRHHLPHLAGTITNLDGASINRSLVSIKSELKRRQDVFNKARDTTGESTMDIYKYLSFYRQGILSQPLPHLFIVADEFAELKQQEPEFMAELISAARIGRSLGVHLILATQKPTGVVDDQIWSNSRFKVCLKVSDAADSREMIQREDAAEITQPGRYYLLVGYNESFSAGQAAYAGGSYMPTDVFEPSRDSSVELLDLEGTVVARMRPQSTRTKKRGAEIEAVITQIEETARMGSKYAHRLWLNPLPEHITLRELANKYDNVEREGFAAIVGEVDDPENQRQFRFDLDIASEGNILLYGSQNSEVDELMQAMLVSMAQAYDSRELQLYCIDYGAGALAVLEELPQCGGVVVQNDDERLQNLIRMLNEQMGERQKLLSRYGGNVAAFNERSGDRMPRIVVAVANIASLIELYQEMEDSFVYLTREGPRYGIHFIVSAATASSVRMRIAANFASNIPTMLNDPSDYLSILGTLRGTTPPQHVKRGLVKMGKRILEFQGVSTCDASEDPYEAIHRIAQVLAQMSMPGVPSIPQLPQYVHVQDMDRQTSATLLPIGFAKKSVAPCYYDFRKSPYMLVLGNDNEPIARYIRGLREALALAQGVTYRIVDLQNSLELQEGDASVLVTDEAVEAFVKDFTEGNVSVDVVIFSSIVQTMAGLSPQVSQCLTEFITSEQSVGSTSLVFTSEVWRVRSIYDNWYKVISAYGNGLWCGSGFADQTVFHFFRSQPEYHMPAERSDAFLTMRGSIEWVRLLEATTEPVDNDFEMNCDEVIHSHL